MQTGSYTSASTLDPELESLSRAGELLGACVAQTRLYGPTHPETVRVIARFEAALQEAAEQLGSTEWTCRQDGFWLGERQFTVEREDRPGLSHALHIEGIASLRFDPGVRREELNELLLVLRINLSLPRYEEETLESLLFQAEFEHIGFEAVSHLMMAEALSGREEDVDATELLERLLELESDRSPDIAAQFDERDPTTGARLRRGDVPVDASDWDTLLSASAGADAEVFERHRESLATERDADLVARLGGLLLRALVSGDRALPPRQALALAETAMRQLYALGDATCLLAFLEEGYSLVDALDAQRVGAGEIVREFLQKNLAPLRVARMLRSLDLKDTRDRYTFRRFATLLPPEMLVVFLEGAVRDAREGEDRGQIRELWTLMGPRLMSLIDAPGTQSESIVALLQAASVAGARPPETSRQTLLRHRSAPVREAILQLLRRELPAIDVPLVVALLTDRVAAVRKAAVDTLARNRPPGAWKELTYQLDRETFHDLDPAVKADLCVAAGRVAGPSAVERLEALLNVRTGLLADARHTSTMEAAARGLAAVHSPSAMRILEKGARSWSGPLRAACQAALQSGATQEGA